MLSYSAINFIVDEKLVHTHVAQKLLPIVLFIFKLATSLHYLATRKLYNLAIGFFIFV